MDALRAAITDKLDGLPLPCMYNPEERRTVDALIAQAKWVSHLLCDLGNGLQEIGFDPMAVAASMKMIGEASTELILLDTRERVKKKKAAAKPFTAFENTTLN